MGYTARVRGSFPFAAAKERIAGLYRRIARLPLLLGIFTLLMALGIVQLSLLTASSLYQVWQWQQERQQLQQQVSLLRSDIELMQEIRQQAIRPATLTELARCQGFVGADEQLWTASPPPPSSVSGNCDPPVLP